MATYNRKPHDSNGVYHEIKGQNDAAGEWIEKFKNDYVIEIDSIPKLIESWDLGKGETEVIAHAYSKKHLKVALDDRAARNCAASVGVNVIGTIGLILLANKKGHITNPVTYLEKLKETGFRISDHLYKLNMLSIWLGNEIVGILNFNRKLCKT